MRKSVLSILLMILFIGVSTFQFAACDAAEEEDLGTTADISADAAASMAPVTEFIIQDSLNMVSEISDNTLVALQSIFTFESVEDIDVVVFKAQQTHLTSSTNPLIPVFDTLNDANTTGEFSIEELAQTLTADTATINDWPGEDCDSSGRCSCTFGGTRTYTGDLTVDLILNTGTGSIAGTYSVIYSNCIDVVTLETNDGSCNAFVNVSGTFTHDVEIDFSNFVETDNLDNVDFARRTILQNSLNSSLFEFSLSANESGPFTAAENIDYDFRYSFRDTTSSSVLPQRDVSTITYDGVEYNLRAVTDFIDSTQTSVVCP